MACSGFVLAGQKKNSGGAESRPKGKNFFSASPAEFDSAAGAEQARGGGAERERGKNINNRD